MTFRYGLLTHESDDAERTACLITPSLFWKNRLRSLLLSVIAAKDVLIRMVDKLFEFVGDGGLDELLEFDGDGGLYNAT
jgi:hypothetical protein